MKKFFIILLCLSLTGCMAMFKPEKRLVSFESDPPGATVILDTVPVGTTPLKLALTDGLPVEVVLQKDGYAPARETIQTHDDMFWVIMQNIPFPIFGMVLGSSFENMSILNKQEVYHNLEPIDSAPKPKARKGKKKP